MKNLKKLREAYNITQKALAEKLGTTQQTIGRWESGKAEPNLELLQKTAVLFGTSVDDLLGKNPLSKEVITNDLYIFAEDGESGFWGHVGVQLTHGSKTIWYPITLKEANRIGQQLSVVDESNPWVVTSALNNRFLFVQPSLVHSIKLLDDAADAPHDDWELSWDTYHGMPADYYIGLEEIGLFNGELMDEEPLPEFKKAIEDIIETEGLDEDALYDLLHDTKLYNQNGDKDSFSTSAHLLVELFQSIEFEDPDKVVRFDDREAIEIYRASNTLALIDTPLEKFKEALNRV